MHRLKPSRLIGVFLELAAKARDVVVHGAGRREGGVAPDDVEKSFTGDGLAGGLGHEAEHRKFLRG